MDLGPKRSEVRNAMIRIGLLLKTGKSDNIIFIVSTF
jgi:hypothetical protein